MKDAALERPSYESLKLTLEHRSSMWAFLEPGHWPKDWEPPDQRVLDALKKDNPNQLFLELIKLVEKRMKRSYPWVAPRQGRTAENKRIECDGLLDPAEIAFDAILAALRGKGANDRTSRKWKDNCTLRQFIWGNARSFLFHAANRSKKSQSNEQAIELAEDPRGFDIGQLNISTGLKEAILCFCSTHPHFSAAVEFLSDKRPGKAVEVARDFGITTSQLAKIVFQCRPALYEYLTPWND